MSKPDNQVNELHLREPQPGDFWHERFCPYHIVLAVTPEGVVITDKTKPDGSSHYTFDLEAAKEITHEEHARAVRYSSGNGFAADVVPVRAVLSVREWKAAGSKYIAVAEQQAASHAGEALMDTNKMRELKALAEAATGGKWVDASTALGGIVRGGPVQQWVNGSGQDQIVMATGAQWMQPDEPRANAAFIAAASPATVLALLAEIERHEAWRTAFLAERDAQMRQRDQLRAENEALRKALLEASEEVATWGAYASEYFQEKHDLAGCVAKLHAAAMAKEADQ